LLLFIGTGCPVRVKYFLKAGAEFNTMGIYCVPECDQHICRNLILQVNT